MLWRTHIKLIYKILRRLGIPNYGTRADSFREGVVAPDKWEDFPHHHGCQRKIRNHILKARKYFLDGDSSRAFFHLGVALHYVQDSYTSLTTRSRHHARWEEQMDEAYFTDNLERLVKNAFYNDPDLMDDYMRRAELLSSKIEGKQATLEFATMTGLGQTFWGRQWGKPYVDVNFALEASYLISESVLSSTTNERFQIQLVQTHQKYSRELQQAEISFVENILASAMKQTEMEQRRQRNGLLQTIKNGVYAGLSKGYAISVKRKLGKYRRQKHLMGVLKAYDRETERLLSPYLNWYEYTLPKLDINDLERELLSVQEAAECFSVQREDILKQLDENVVSCYDLLDDTFVRRSELAAWFEKSKSCMESARKD